VHGFSIWKQDDPEDPPARFRYAPPASEAAIRLHGISLRIVNGLLNPFPENPGSVGPVAERLKVAGGSHEGRSFLVRFFRSSIACGCHELQTHNEDRSNCCPSAGFLSASNLMMPAKSDGWLPVTFTLPSHNAVM